MSAPPATGVWPFLVARGRSLGYRVLVVPGFLADRNEGGVLYPVVEAGDGDAPAVPRRQVLRTSGGRSVSVVFREVVVDGAELGLPAGPLRDAFGRTVTMFEGYAAEGSALPPDADWRPAHDIATATMLGLLAAESRGAGPEDIPVTISRPLPLPTGPVGPSEGGGLTRLTVILLTAAVLAVVIAVLFFSSRG